MMMTFFEHVALLMYHSVFLKCGELQKVSIQYLCFVYKKEDRTHYLQSNKSNLASSFSQYQVVAGKNLMNPLSEQKS